MTTEVSYLTGRGETREQKTKNRRAADQHRSEITEHSTLSDPSYPRHLRLFYSSVSREGHAAIRSRPIGGTSRLRRSRIAYGRLPGSRSKRVSGLPPSGRARRTAHRSTPRLRRAETVDLRSCRAPWCTSSRRWQSRSQALRTYTPARLHRTGASVAFESSPGTSPSSDRASPEMFA